MNQIIDQLAAHPIMFAAFSTLALFFVGLALATDRNAREADEATAGVEQPNAFQMIAHAWRTRLSRRAELPEDAALRELVATDHADGGDADHR